MIKSQHCPNCEATEQKLHDLRQRVSYMASAYIKHAHTVQEKHLTGYKVTVAFEKHDDAIAWFDQLLFLPEFIIPAPKPDPLVDVFCRGLWSEAGLSISTKEIRAALDALGFEIRDKNDAH